MAWTKHSRSKLQTSACSVGVGNGVIVRMVYRLELLYFELFTNPRLIQAHFDTEKLGVQVANLSFVSSA
jgi:hypothetical protein